MKRLCIILVGVMFFVGSCEKGEQVQLDEPLSIESAKIWFDRTIENRKARTTGSEDEKNALWEKAEYKDFGFGKVIVVPIKYQDPLYPSFSEEGKSKQSKYRFSTNDFNYLVVSKDNSFKAIVAKLVPTEKYLEKSNGRKKKVAYEGLFILEDWNGDFVEGFSYKNGKATNKLVNGKKARSTSDWECWTYTQWSCASGDGGQTWNCSEMYSNTYCSGGPANEDQWIDPDYSGGGGGGSSGNGNNNGSDIQVFINNPCIKSQVENLLLGGIASTITQQFNSAFGMGGLPPFITFVEDPSLVVSARTIEVGTNSLEIRINPTVATTASKEYMAVVIIHEMTHAVLYANGVSMVGPVQHEIMLNNYADVIANCAMAYFPIQYNDAFSISLKSLQGDTTPLIWANAAALRGLTYSSVDNINYAYKNNNIGTAPCN